jgi:PDZ domain-containing protein
VPRLALPSLERIPGGRAFAALSRRVRALIVAGVLFLVLFILTLTLPVPYVILSPGPTCNVLGTDTGAHCVGGSGAQIIVIKGKQANTTSGNLNLTTVSESGDSVTAFQALIGWLKHDQVVVPYSSINPPGTSEQQTAQQNAADFSESQDNAVAAASCELKYPKKLGVTAVNYPGPSYGKLRPGDVITSVDGAPVGSQATVDAALDKTQPKQTITLGVLRAGKTTSTKVTLGAAVAKQSHKGGSLGIALGTVCALPFTVDLGLGNQIGGPSAGMMFALGIMEKVGSVDLTHGRFIAGTGTIDPDGASVFLAPSGNCGDVSGNIPSGLQVVKVSTLHQAVTDLERTAKKESVPSC